MVVGACAGRYRRNRRPSRRTRSGRTASLLNTAPSGSTDISVEGLTWRPARRHTAVLTDVELHIPAGQRVLVAGPSGAGKSTLLRALAGLLLTADHGDLSGRVTHNGREIIGAADHVGLLLQDPRAAVVAQTVGRDVAFGLENQRVPRPEIWERVTRALADSGFPYGIEHSTAALSGGETQRLALAGSLVLDSGLLLLDEPTSMLDPTSADTVRAAVRRFADLANPTIVIVEHRLGPWLDFAHRLIVLGADGSIVADGEPRATLAGQAAALARQGVWVPGAGDPEPDALEPLVAAPTIPRSGWAVRTEQASVAFRPGLTRHHEAPTIALDAVSVDMRSGEALVVTGPSGSGKSTLVTVLAGLHRPSAGAVFAADDLATAKGVAPWRWSSRDLAARLAWMPQIPEQGIVESTLLEEVTSSARACGRDRSESEQRAKRLLDALGLSHLSNASPYHLSGGEQRRVMLAAALCHGPSAILLDEPTVGQDRATWAAVVGAVASARDAGMAVVVATHDQGAAAALADRSIAMSRGATT